jgi:hypothetical protein
VANFSLDNQNFGDRWQPQNMSTCYQSVESVPVNERIQRDAIYGKFFVGKFNTM